MTRVVGGDFYPGSGICRVLSWEHERILRTVARLCEPVENEDGLKVRRMLFDSIREEILLHARTEESVLYPEARQLSELKHFVRHSRSEHDDLEAMLRELDAIAPDHWKWEMKMRHFAVELEHHLQDEEQELFPRILRRMSRARQSELEREYWKVRRRLETTLHEPPQWKDSEAAA